MGTGAADDGPAADELVVAVSPTVSRWGDAARLFVARVGGRWPADGSRQVALCGFVHYRSTPQGARWVVDDVIGFATAAGARVAGGAIQPTLGLEIGPPGAGGPRGGPGLRR